jgi:Zn-dependent protease with chaperone function
MFSDGLLEGMSRPHLRAVMAHELGHVVRRHMIWLIIVLLACGVVAIAAVEPLAIALFDRLAADADPSAQESIVQATSIGRDIGILAVALVFFGYASRRFERQADTFAVQLISRSSGRDSATPEAIEDVAGALRMVAYLNHIPISRGSWRHGSIQWRMRYLRLLDGAPLALLPIDTQVAVIRWGSAAIVIAALALEFIAR